MRPLKRNLQKTWKIQTSAAASELCKFTLTSRNSWLRMHQTKTTPQHHEPLGTEEKTDLWPVDSWSKFPHSSAQIASIMGSAFRADKTPYRHHRSSHGTNKQTESSPFVMVVYKGGHGADLDSVRVVGWIFKQPVVRVEQLSGHQEEKLSGGPAVVQPVTQAHHENTQTRKCWELCSSAAAAHQLDQRRNVFSLMGFRNRVDDPQTLTQLHWKQETGTGW